MTRTRREVMVVYCVDWECKRGLRSKHELARAYRQLSIESASSWLELVRIQKFRRKAAIVVVHEAQRSFQGHVKVENLMFIF